MKLHRILGSILLLVIIFNLVSCDQLNFHHHNHSTTPTENTTPDENEPTPITYYYSIVQKVIHLEGCFHIDNMEDDYRFKYTGDISVLLAKGYTLCEDCIAKEEPEEEVFVPDPDEVEPELATYIINRTKLTIHKRGCYHIEKMAERNIKYTCLSYEELLANDHAPCGTCMPDEYEAYKKAHPEKFENE